MSPSTHSCHTTKCHTTVSYNTVSHNTMSHISVSLNTVSHNTVSTTQFYTTHCHITQCDTTQCHKTQCHITMSHITVSHNTGSHNTVSHNTMSHNNVTYKKGKFLYSAVSSPQDRSKRFTLYFSDRPVHSDTTRLLWEASSHMLQLMCEGCSCTYPPLSIARYSYTQLSELEQCRVKKLPQGFNTAASRIRTRVLIVKSPKFYP